MTVPYTLQRLRGRLAREVFGADGTSAAASFGWRHGRHADELTWPNSIIVRLVNPRLVLFARPNRRTSSTAEAARPGGCAAAKHADQRRPRAPRRSRARARTQPMHTPAQPRPPQSSASVSVSGWSRWPPERQNVSSSCLISPSAALQCELLHTARIPRPAKLATHGGYQLCFNSPVDTA